MCFEESDKLNLIKQDIDNEHILIKHYINNSDEYEINIICCEFKDKKLLEKNWYKIIENIAMYVQTELTEEIECYNVYTIFFCKDVDKNLLNIIEHDKYSSRKIVINENMPKSNKELLTLINDRLFTIRINKEEQYNKINNNNIDSEYLEMIGIINDKSYTLKEKLEKILNERLD